MPTVRIGRKKTRRTLRENETLEYAETIETNIGMIIQITRILIKIDGEKNIHTTIGLKAWNRKHPNNKMTEEQYVAYRKQKERKRKNNELR